MVAGGGSVVSVAGGGAAVVVAGGDAVVVAGGAPVVVTVGGWVVVKVEAMVVAGGGADNEYVQTHTSSSSRCTSPHDSTRVLLSKLAQRFAELASL